MSQIAAAPPPGAGRDPSVLLIEGHSIIADALAVAMRSCGIPVVTTVDPHELDPASIVRMAVGFSVVVAGLLVGDGRTTLSLIGSLVDRGSRVLALATDQGAPLAGNALRAGVVAVVHKDMPLDRLVDAIRAVDAGRQVLTDDERRALLEVLPEDGHDEARLLEPFAALTAREAATLRHLVVGHSPKAVAVAENVTIHTVRKHIRGILTKLDVQSQREALALARHAGWPPPAPDVLRREDEGAP